MFFFFLCWTLTGLGAEPDPSYQIELIIFSHINEEGLRSEHWPLLPAQKITKNAVELSEDQLIPESQWLLKSSEQLLKHNNNTILLHTAWQESALEARKLNIIHLTGGETYPDDLRQLNGTISISLDRYFNIHFNLRFLMPWDNIKDLNLINIAPENGNPYISFKINAQLRMRSNELNYIDHPLYGILIKIIPLASTTQKADVSPY